MKNMRRICAFLAVFACLAFPVMATPTISLSGSHQYISTFEFETNEYDALVNPLQFEKIGGNRLFIALDVNSNLLGENLQSLVSSKGFNGGVILSLPTAPRFMIDYADASNSSSAAPEGGTTITRTGYNIATGTYASISEAVSYTSLYAYNARDLVFSAGLVAVPGIDIAIQALWQERDYNSTAISYSNTYDNAAAVSPAALTSKGNLSQTVNTLSAGNGSPTSKLAGQVQAGLTFGSFSSLASLGANWIGAAAPSAAYRTTTTSYSSGGDPTVRDEIDSTSYSGAYYYNGSTYTTPISLTGMGVSSLPRIGLTLDTKNTLNLAKDLDLVFPISATINLPAGSIAAVQTTDNQSFDDALPATASYFRRTVDTVTTTVVPSYSLAFGGGIGVKKSFAIDEAIALHAGSTLACNASFDAARITKSDATRTVLDLGSDGTLAAGTDTDTTTTLDGLESSIAENKYVISLSVPISISYSVTPKLSFHAGCSTSLGVTLDSLAKTANTVGAYSYMTTTDALVAANSTARQRIDGVTDSAATTNAFTSNFNVTAASAFGFTMKISDKFAIDALSSLNSLSVYSFSVTGSIAF
jgi:hypothetical protein